MPQLELFENNFVCTTGMIHVLVVNSEANSNTLEHPMGRVDSRGNIRLEYKSHTHGIAPCLSHIHRGAECVGQFQFARLDWNNLQYWELHDKYLWILVTFKEKKRSQ